MQFRFAKLSLRLSQKVVGCILAALTMSAQSFAMAQEEPISAIVYQQDGSLSEELNMPIYQWSAPQAPAKGIVLAIHGVAMHGKSYDRLGKTLAEEGYIVCATDLRGYGRCIDDAKACKIRDCRHKVDYDKSYQDIRRLARSLRDRYPTLPIFAVGESLGGAMVIRLAAQNPELVDGLVLSSPAVKRHSLIDPYLIVNTGLFLTNPRIQLDLMPFVRRYSSDDPRVVAEKESDPLLRRHMSAYELLKSTNAIRKTTGYLASIPADTPLLVMQGGGDKILRADAVMTLLSKVHSNDQTVKWFSERGHILLETDYVKPDTMEAVITWLNSHVQSPAIQSKCHRSTDYVATHTDNIQQASFRVQLPEIEQN